MAIVTIKERTFSVERPETFNGFIPFRIGLLQRNTFRLVNNSFGNVTLKLGDSVAGTNKIINNHGISELILAAGQSADFMKTGAGWMITNVYRIITSHSGLTGKNSEPGFQHLTTREKQTVTYLHRDVDFWLESDIYITGTTFMFSTKPPEWDDIVVNSTRLLITVTVGSGGSGFGVVRAMGEDDWGNIFIQVEDVNTGFITKLNVLGGAKKGLYLNRAWSENGRDFDFVRVDDAGTPGVFEVPPFGEVIETSQKWLDGNMIRQVTLRQEITGASGTFDVPDFRVKAGGLIAIDPLLSYGYMEIDRGPHRDTSRLGVVQGVGDEYSIGVFFAGQSPDFEWPMEYVRPHYNFPGDLSNPIFLILTIRWAANDQE